MTDAELIIASRRDPRAFRALYDRWAERLLAYFYRRVLDPEVAADLLAETFAVAYVFPGRGTAVCRRLGLTPLAAGYAAARARVIVLQRRIEALENSSNCIPPGLLLRRVDALLLRSGWIAWHAYVLHNSLPVGPCGSVSTLDGAGRRGITGSLDPDTHQVTVFTGPPRGLSRSRGGRTRARQPSSAR